MDAIVRILQRNSTKMLRYSLAVVLFWIGGLKFSDPSPVVNLLHASLPFLASPGFVYALGVFEISAAALLVTGKALRIVSLLVAGQFAGTLLIFVMTPAVTYVESGFPGLSLAGEFLLKDIVLLASTLVVFAAQWAAPSRSEPGVA